MDQQTQTLLLALVALGACSVALIILLIKYSGNRLEKPLSTLTGLYGTIFGVIGGYYFSNENVKQLKAEVGDNRQVQQRTLDFCKEDWWDIEQDYRSEFNRNELLNSELSIAYEALDQFEDLTDQLIDNVP